MTYVKDAYLGPIVMLRGPKGRYCQFVGITVSSAQICRDAYCIWPRMMPRAELGININLSYAGIDINLSYAGININSKLVLNPTEGGIILTLSNASLRSPITRSLRSQSNTWSALLS